MDIVQGAFSLGISMGQTPKQLQKELDELQLKLPSARLLISRREWVMFKDKDLQALVLQLKYATYDAEDLLRRFEDEALRQKIEDAGRSRAGQIVTSCPANVKHLMLRTSESIMEMQARLEKVMAEVERVMGLDGFQPPVQFMPTTTQVITASEVFGRDTERDQLMEMLGVTSTIGRDDEFNQVFTQIQLITQSGSKGKSPAAEAAGPGVDASTTPKAAKRHKGESSSTRSAVLAETTNFISNVSVLPIFGIGGMGKTTLAQLIYNDERVKAHFTVRIWVCVSDLFDIDRLTKEITKTISPNFDVSCALGVLQVQLMEELKSQKFVLVLDDICWQITQQQWESFYAPLRNGLEGSMILVTTRHENIADLVATGNCKPVQLKGLPHDIFWEFFKKCAFGKESPESYPHLQVIGRSISSKLSGTPLAAKTLGRLLNRNLTEQHWMAINNSELWQQEQNEGEILPALRLSYLYLPTELRRCFAFCSIFPKDYSFEKNEIVDIWVAEGFVASVESMCLEDVGMRYLDELRDRCLFQADPNSPNRYVMHDLIHDTAQYVSMHECFSMKDFSRVDHELRHMSVELDGKSLSPMIDIQHLNKFRSLRFGTKLDAEITWFSQLSNILFLSLKRCKLEILPQSICELSSLRYLDISYSSVRELPETLWRLYSLQVLDAMGSKIKTIHQDVTKLINLRYIALPEKASRDLPMKRGLGNLSHLRNLRFFAVGKRKEAIGELKCMNQLRGTLCIKYIHNLKSKKQAAEARLTDKEYLKAIDLHWRITPRKTKELLHVENEVFEGLCPHKRIERLTVHQYWGDRLPSWFNAKYLQNLRSLELYRCWFIETLLIPNFSDGMQGGSTGQHARSGISCSNGIASFPFTHFISISLVSCDGLKSLDQFLLPKNLPSIQSILLEECQNLESIPADSFGGFVHLRDLKIGACRGLVCPQGREMVLPPSLQRLCIIRCGQLDKSFPSCLDKATSLTVLFLLGTDNVESIPLDSIPCRNTLKFLALHGCRKLSSIGASGVPSSIQYVKIIENTMLTQVQQPYEKNKNAPWTQEISDTNEFIGKYSFYFGYKGRP